MNTLIPPGHYFDLGVFVREAAAVFGPSWHLIGFCRDLAEPNSFITGDINSHSVVVQNFSGELRAFRNVCSHRFSRIQTAPKGIGALRCPYHGWTYDSQGLPTAIPARPRFDDLTPARISSLCLLEYRLATCGELVFVNPSREGPTLRDYLGAAWEVVEKMGAALGPQIDIHQLHVKANWKILVENTLEAYHVPLVHRNTFHKLNFEFKDQDARGPHTWWRGDFGPKTLASFQRVAELYAGRPYQDVGYLHQFIYPNVTLATTFGTSFSIQVFTPIDPDSTRFVSYMFRTRLDGELPQQSEKLEWMNQSTAAFNRQVFEEDAAICEKVQLGVKDAPVSKGILSDEEVRVAAFHESYMRQMSAPPDA